MRWAFLRAFGVVALVAFLSLWVQLEGLFGSQGIMPAEDLLGRVRDQVAVGERFWTMPTVFWWGASDLMLHLMAGIGVLACLSLILGVLSRLSALIIWFSYLSLTLVGGVFFGYQWDVLLIETAFLAALFAPGVASGRRTRLEVHRFPLWALRFLLFKLMFLSGLSKLMSGDPVWADLTALTHHFETQPLPHIGAYYAHQLPAWLQQVNAAVMFGVELLLPFFVFGPRRFRLIAFWGFLGLMLAIMATGNYGFFNLLALALCIPLLDEKDIRPRLERFGWRSPEEGSEPGTGLLSKGGLGTVSAVYLVLSLTVVVRGFYAGNQPPGWTGDLLQWQRSFRTVNSYGLFANMTTERPELILQGTRDGRTWKRYGFPWKPGDPSRSPGWVQPHMPRVDWQFWFAALGDIRRNPWLLRFMQGIFQGNGTIEAFLARNPFPDEGPRALRIVSYQYRFAGPGESAWWERGESRVYVPALNREQVERALQRR